jgi:hypothetical protein
MSNPVYIWDILLYLFEVINIDIIFSKLGQV